MADAAPEAAAPHRRRVFYGWWIVTAGAGIQLLAGALIGQAFGAYVVLLREEFGWSKTVLSAASSLREAESGVTGPLQGWLLNRLGPRLVMQIGLVIFAGGFFWFAFVDSLLAFFGAFFVISVGASLCGYLTITYAAVQWFERRRATAISLTTAGFAAGGIASRLTVQSMEQLGWRETAFLSGIILLVLGLPLAQLIRWRPADSGLLVDGDPPHAELSPGGMTRLELDASRDFTLREALHTRAFWFVSFGHASALFIVSAMNVHLLSHLKESLGYSLSFAATIALVLPLLFLTGTMIGGPVGDRFSKRWLVVGCMFGHASGLLLLAYASNVAMVLAFTVLHGLAWGLRGPQMAAIRADYFGRSSFATILGFSNMIIIIGTISGPIIAGFMYDQTGDYRLGFDILAGLAAAGSVFFIFATKPVRPARA
ncbi:MAG: MFS transporter [Dehalococcoidia bacterium]